MGKAPQRHCTVAQLLSAAQQKGGFLDDAHGGAQPPRRVGGVENVMRIGAVQIWAWTGPQPVAQLGDHFLAIAGARVQKVGPEKHAPVFQSMEGPGEFFAGGGVGEPANGIAYLGRTRSRAGQR